MEIIVPASQQLSSDDSMLGQGEQELFGGQGAVFSVLCLFCFLILMWPSSHHITVLLLLEALTSDENILTAVR